MSYQQKYKTTILYERKERAEIPGKNPELPRILLIEAQLYHIEGNSSPHFSLTGEFRAEGVCGCIHDIILKHRPEYKIIADLHLSDDKGVPMHALENGWYWLGKTKWQERDNEVLARHLRIPIEDAKMLSFNSKFEFSWYIDGLKERWLKEAEEGIKFLKEEV